MSIEEAIKMMESIDDSEASEPQVEVAVESEGEGETVGKDAAQSVEVEAEPAKDPPPKLAKQQARLAQKEARLLELEGNLRKLQEDVQSKASTFEELSQLARKDPMAFLAKAGVDIDILGRQLLHGEKPKPKDPTIEALETQISKLAEQQKQLLELEEKRKQESEKYSEHVRQQAVTQWQEQIKTHVESLAEDSYLKADVPRSIRKIQQTVKAHYAKTKQVLDISDAAGRVEKEIETQYQSLTSVAHKKNGQPAPQQKSRGNTTTLGPNTGSRVAKRIEEMTDDERLAHAAKLLEDLEM